MFAHNDYRLGVRNGERGTITALDLDERTVTVHVNDRTADTSDDLHVTVPAEYLEAGDLVWGYAATVHKNQGATSDYSYLLASDALYRELGYTALSRGRIENRIWTVDIVDVDDDLEHAHTPEPDTPRDPIAELVRAMERSAAQQMAIDEADTLPDVDPDRSVDVDELIARRDAIGAALFRSAPLRVTDELTDATRRLAVAERRLTEADDHDWAITIRVGGRSTSPARRVRRDASPLRRLDPRTSRRPQRAAHPRRRDQPGPHRSSRRDRTRPAGGTGRRDRSSTHRRRRPSRLASSRSPPRPRRRPRAAPADAAPGLKGEPSEMDVS